MAIFNFRWRRKIKRAFLSIAGRDHLIDYAEWKQAIGLRNDLLARHMFSLVDVDQSGYIDRDEFARFAQMLLSKKVLPRLEFVFNSYDLNGDEKIEPAELQQVISASLDEQGLMLTDDVVENLADCFFERAGVNKKRCLDRAAFCKLLQSQPDIEGQLDAFARNLLNLRPRKKRVRIRAAGLFLRLRRSFRNHGRQLFWFIAYLAANIYLFATAMDSYAAAGAGLAIQVARGAGACLYFNAALILLPMCKGLMSFLRHTFLFRFLPLDHLTSIHKGIAFSVIGFSAIHIGAHLTNYWKTHQNIGSMLLQTGVGISGLVMTVALLAMWYTSRITRQRNHELFAAGHYLYAPFLIALLPHAMDAWIWLAPSLSLYFLDGSLRWIFKNRRVEITGLEALSDGVTSVRLKRGLLFRFRPGDYINIKIPTISRWQWHPFTISASPEASRIDIHVRNNGNWSGALHNLARKKHAQRKKWKARIDGPYAAPTSSIYRSKVAILIAGGIGVTPFASVLHSLLVADKRRKTSMEQMVYFHWLNRSQKSYEWFVDLLSRAEGQLGDKHFKLFIHLTSLTRDLSNIAMQISLDAYREKWGKDPITELHSVTAAGRPNWGIEFEKVAKQHVGEIVDVYFCGPEALGTDVRKMANKHGFLYHEERF